MAASDTLLTFPEKRAAEIAGVTLRKLKYWNRTELVKPAAERQFSPRSSVRLYGFEDTVALYAVAVLQQRGLSLQHIRKVLEHLRLRGYERPFTDLVFATLGHDIYFQHPDGSWEGGATPDQLVLRQVLDLDFIREKVRAGAGRQPSEFGKVERRRKTMGHKLVFAGTRIPIETVVRRLDHGRSPRQIIEAYPDLVPADVELARKHVASA